MSTPYPLVTEQETRAALDSELPAHVAEELGGYIGPALRRRMALRRKATPLTESHPSSSFACEQPPMSRPLPGVVREG